MDSKNIIKSNKEYTWFLAQISCAIDIYINKVELEVLKALYNECTPKRIIEDLNLKNICHEYKTKFGHFKY